MDTLEFRLRAPDPEREPWVEHSQVPQTIVEIWLNGQELVPLLREIEMPYAPEIAGGYGHLRPDELYPELTAALASGGERSAALLCCDGCGFIGCWSVHVEVREDGGAVSWGPFAHNHRDWAYPLSYRFEKGAYRQAMEQLKAFMETET